MDIPATNSILHQFNRYLLSKGFRTATAEGHQYHLRVFLAWLEKENLRYETVRYQDLLAFIRYRQKEKCRPVTINRYLTTLQHFYDYLQKQEIITRHPCVDLRLKNVVKKAPYTIIEQEELERLHRSFPVSNIFEQRNKVMLGVIIYQGLMINELRSLQRGDVTLEEGKIHIPGSTVINARTLLLKPGQILEMLHYLQKIRPAILKFTGNTNEKLFVSKRHRSLLKNGLEQIMERVREMNPSVKGFRQIRASVITHWLKSHHLRQVQYMAGHQKVSSTLKYQTHQLETLQEQIETLHPFQ